MLEMEELEERSRVAEWKLGHSVVPEGREEGNLRHINMTITLSHFNTINQSDHDDILESIQKSQRY